MDIKIYKDQKTTDFNVRMLDEKRIKISLRNEEEIFDFSSLAPGGVYFVCDCLKLTYCPIERIIVHADQSIEVFFFFSDKHFIDPPAYTRQSVKYLAITSPDTFNLAAYKAEVCKKVTALCVDKNYSFFPQYKRDNVYAGEPATAYYPEYLKGEAGRQSIAKLNAYFQQFALEIQSRINTSSVETKEQVDMILSSVLFPTDDEILLQLTK